MVGELKKLGLRSIKKSTVRNILKAQGLHPFPKRSGATWDEFLARHAAGLWQCEFFTQKVPKVKDIREAFVLAFLNFKTRRVVLSPATFHPEAAWVARQAEVFAKRARTDGLRIGYVQRDRDDKFGDAFDATLRKLRVKAIRSAPQAPKTQAFVERFIGSIHRECMEHFIFSGSKHLDSVIRVRIEHYHAERQHQGRENELLVRPQGTKKAAGWDIASLSLRDIRCRKRLVGLLKHYERVAA